MTKYKVNGKYVTHEEFLAGCKGIDFGGRAPATLSSKWPMKSDAAGVHPSQVQEAMEHARSVGVPTEFTKDGQAVFTSREHRKRFCEAHGLFDRNGGYGDPQKRS